MGWLTRLLGYEGLVRFEGQTTDGEGFTGTCEISTIGNSREDVEAYLARKMEVKYGKPVKFLKIVDAE